MKSNEIVSAKEDRYESKRKSAMKWQFYFA